MEYGIIRRIGEGREGRGGKGGAEGEQRELEVELMMRSYVKQGIADSASHCHCTQLRTFKGSKCLPVSATTSRGRFISSTTEPLLVYPF